MAYTKEQLLDAYRKLPEAIKEVVSEVDSVKIIKELGERHHLHIDQLGELADEVGSVLFGLNRAEDFATNLKNRLGFDDQRAGEIAAEVDREIFLPTRERVKQKTESLGEEPTETTPIASPANEPALPTQEEILREIENPAPLIPPAPEEEKKTVFEQKMGGVFPQAPPPPAAEPKIKDPYLEPVE